MSEGGTEYHLYGNMQWDEAADALLRFCVTAGSSAEATATEISAFAKRPVSRNAVLGRAGRLGLTFKGRRTYGTAPGRRTSLSPGRPPAVKPAAPSLPAVVVTKEATFQPDALIAAALTEKPSADGRRYGVMDLFDARSDNCRFPLWESHETPHRNICGEKTAAAGHSYCLRHMTVCFGALPAGLVPGSTTEVRAKRTAVLRERLKREFIADAAE